MEKGALVPAASAKWRGLWVQSGLYICQPNVVSIKCEVERATIDWMKRTL